MPIHLGSGKDFISFFLKDPRVGGSLMHGEEKSAASLLRGLGRCLILDTGCQSVSSGAAKASSRNEGLGFEDWPLIHQTAQEGDAS